MEYLNTLEDDKNAIDNLFHRSLKFRNSKEYLEFFRFLGKIFHYSHYNAMLVYWQNPEVRFFGTPGYWNKNFNRRVNENARPYIILIPFGPATLAYDVMDTSGELPPEVFISEGLKGELYQVKGYLPAELYGEIKKSLAEYNILVKESVMPASKGGETYNGKGGATIINISKSFGPEQAFATLIHELAHNFLGHLGEKTLVKQSMYVRGENKGLPKIETIRISKRDVDFDIREIEAETVSYLVCCRWNLESFAEKYVSCHITEENIKRVSPITIIKAADKVNLSSKFL